jgi:lipopolysaccharide/colanic/teichoic acid biosynthesis glycosyltransferase
MIDEPGSGAPSDPPSDTSDPARTRFAHLSEDGTGYILAGSLVAGLAAYAYQILGGRTLGADAFAPVSVLLTIHFLTFIVILLPIEQLIIRRLTLDRTAVGVPPRALALASATVVGATLYAGLRVDELLNGDRRFIVFTAFTVIVHSLFAVARGHLAGFRRFREYGLASGGASLFRLLVAMAVLAVRPSASGVAIGLIAGPLIVMVWRPFRRVEVNRPGLADHELANVSSRGLLSGLVLSSAASQMLLLAGPLVAAALGAADAVVSGIFAMFTLFRAPLTFGYNLIARILPPFTEMAARRERRELRAWARGMTYASTVLALLGGVAGYLIGPQLVALAFGADFRPGETAAALVAAGVLLAGAGLFVAQILVARGRPFVLAAAWLVAVVAAALVLAATGGEIEVRVSLAFLIGEVVALAALVLGAVAKGPDETTVGAGYLLAKRTLDIAVATLAIVLSAPLLLAAVVAVKLDSRGPAFFRQERLGRGGRPFAMLKLRTMRADGGEDVFIEHLARLEASRHDAAGHAIRIEDDPRVTRVGRLLRRSSLDELPNLWNVLKGSMSLVGPRPLVPEEAALIGLDNLRFSVKPGVTGLAQITGRDTIDLDARTRLDLEYVARRSGRLDAAILGRTVLAVFRQPGQ